MAKRTMTGGSNGFTPGPHHRGEGYTPISDEIVFREFTRQLSNGERFFLLACNRMVWLKGTLELDLAAIYVHEAANFPIRSIERYLSPSSRLLRLMFFRPIRKVRRSPSRLLVEPVFIWSSLWDQLEHFEKSLLRFAPPRPSKEELEKQPALKRLDRWAAILAELDRHFGGSTETDPRTLGRHSGGDPISDLSNKVDAVHRSERLAGLDEELQRRKRERLVRGNLQFEGRT